MQTTFSCGKKVKEAVLSALKGDVPFTDFSALLESNPEQRLVCPLFSAVLQPDQHVRWHAVTAFGLLLPQLWTKSPERARVVLRRFIWNLNEESGGIGWGMPESMAESLGAVPELAAEFTNVFLSYIHEKKGPDNFLDHAPLRRGALWGVARLAQLRPDLAQNACPDLLHLLATEQDPECLGLVCLALSLLPSCTLAPIDVQHLHSRADTPVSFTLYWNRTLHTVAVGQLARQADPTR